MKAFLLMAIVFLYCDQPVASLQFDLETGGTVTLQSTVQKQIVTAPVNGKIRVIIYGLNQVVFRGRFAQVSGPVAGISGVVGASVDGTQVDVKVTKVSPARGLQIEKK
jgi:hypothetical protein